MNQAREFDIIVWGATGFTGRLVAEYLCGHGHGDGLRWAMAGRNLQRLETLRRDLSEHDPGAAQVDLLVADGEDRAALAAMVARTRVIISMVGPYARHGSALVAACAEAGVDYCDITGEVHWMRRMIDLHHDTAERSGARIVHACGFDAIPSDLSCLLVQEHALATAGRPCRSVTFYLRAAMGTYSGGTVATLLDIIERASRDRDVARLLADPYALNPATSPTGQDGPDLRGVAYDRDLGCWTSPSIMARINTRVVRRSNALLGHRYGTDFRYREVTAHRGASGLRKAVANTAAIKGMMAIVRLPPGRALVRRFMAPAPGEGPSRQERDAGYYSAIVLGLLPDGARIQARAAGQGDPGYKATSMMVAETGLCLALDDDVPRRGGVLTTACLGLPLVDRLRGAGMTLSISEESLGIREVQP